MMYPDEAIVGTLTDQELLFSADRTITMAREESEDDEKVCQLIIAHLSMLCYGQGVQSFIEQMSDDPVEPLEKMKGALIECQKKWELVSDYCRDTLDIHLHSFAMLMFLRFSACSEDQTREEKVMVEAIDQYAAEMMQEAQDSLENLKEPPAESVPDIENFTGDKAKLVTEFFTLLEQIGTFHQDRDKYETEEQKQLHDRIVAIYNRISTTD